MTGVERAKYFELSHVSETEYDGEYDEDLNDETYSDESLEPEDQSIVWEKDKAKNKAKGHRSLKVSNKTTTTKSSPPTTTAAPRSTSTLQITTDTTKGPGVTSTVMYQQSKSKIH